MASLARALLLASTLPFAHVASAQTIEVDGQKVAANDITVAPAGEPVAESTGSGAETLQLTDAVISNLTDLQLSNISLFTFAEDAAVEKRSFAACKTFPGDALWPTTAVWKVMDLLTGGALIKTVPIGAVCYPDNAHYDAAKCADILENWQHSETHARDPTSVMSPLYQGETCMPQNGNTSTCELGGFPSYVVKATNVAQIQLAVNLARNLNLRLVVHNTGHDFLGKSTGAGALSIWTHHLKDVQFLKSYTTPSYKGAALKVGAGIQVGELYAAANKYGVTAVGGECKGVGVSGGYMAGGGHSPLTGKFGMGSDSVLSIDVVTPDGRFVTADEKNNADLFWALRGGGGATFGVVTGMTLKAHPRMTFSGVTWAITTGNDTAISDDVFWAAMDVYWRRFADYAETGGYGYSQVFSRGPGLGFTWSMRPWLVPGASLDEFKALVAPLFADWAALGFEFEPEYFTHDNFYDTWLNHFPTEVVANSNIRTASRLFPRGNWADAATLNATLAAIRGVVEAGSALIQYNVNGAAPAGTPASAVNPAWRENVFFGIFGAAWAAGVTTDELAAVNKKITREWMQQLRDVTPGSGGYLNEGDVMEPDFQQAFFGTNYDRLLAIKKKVDPHGVFWAPTAVGSEAWYVTRQEDWLTLQTGRLCRAS